MEAVSTLDLGPARERPVSSLRPRPPVEPVPEVVAPVVVEPGLVDGRGEHGVDRELGRHGLAEGQRPLLVIAEDRLGEVVDPDAPAHQPKTE